MTTARSLTRAVASVLVAMGLVLVAAGAVSAASPSTSTVGGRLAAVGNTVTVTSQGSEPVHVVLTADVVRLPADASFDLQPGETRSLTFSGEALGRVYATLSARSVATSADSNSLVLSVGLKPWTPPFDWTPGVAAGLTALGALLVIRRARPWEWRLVRAASG